MWLFPIHAFLPYFSFPFFLSLNESTYATTYASLASSPSSILEIRIIWHLEVGASTIPQRWSDVKPQRGPWPDRVRPPVPVLGLQSMLPNSRGN
ncbi:hypothetical protein BDV11DRAFT_51661 [Aspergillus similis]